ncbi:MAG: superfamily II DNA or RNA helicase, partial [Myxococcota bacterium]
MPIRSTDLILDALAVSEDALTLTALAHVLTSAKVRINGKKPTTATVQPLVTALVNSGAVTQSSRVEPVYPDCELRARALLRSGRYEKVVGWVADAEPLKPMSRWGHDESRTGTSVREYRRALHRGDVEALTDLRRRVRVGVWRWFAKPMAIDLLRMLPPSTATDVLKILSVVSFQHALPAPALSNLIYESVPKQPALLETAIFETLLHGETDRADAFLGLLDKDAGLHLRALRALIEGNLKVATSLYAKGLTADRRRHGTPKVVPMEPAALFLPLAYMLSSSKSRGSQAVRVIELADKEDLVIAELPWGGWKHVATLNEPGAESELACTHPVAVLLEGLCTWWRGETLDPARHKAAIEKASACGWGWVADELTCGAGGEGLSSLRIVRTEWAHRLDLLAELLGEKPAKMKAKTKAEKRLAWTLSTNRRGLSLEAREQLSRGKKWSVGRKVAHTRLLGTGTPPTTTPADRALIAGLRSETSRSYRGYPEVWYSWDPEVAWPALVGHPAIFDKDENPLTIIRIPPRIVVKKVKGTSTVSIEPALTDGTVKVVKVGNGYEITVFTKEQQRVAEIIGGGMQIPTAGQAALDRVLSATDGIFERSKTRTAAKKRPGDPTVSVQLRPEGKSILAALVVHPLGAGGHSFPPGAGSAIVLGHVGKKAVRVQRDLAAEVVNMEAVLGLPGLITADAVGDRWQLDGPQDCLVLLEALKEAGISVFWPDKTSFTFRKTVSASDLKMTIAEVKNWFQASGTLTVDEGLALSLKELLAAVLANGGRFIKLNDGSFIALESSLRRDLDALARTVQKQRSKLAVHPLAAHALATLAESSQTKTDPGFTRHLKRLTEIPESAPLPASLGTSLRGYQEEGFQWLSRLSHSGVGALLADDMGLGKTVVALTLLLHRRALGPVLIVAPTSVAGNWMREMLRFAPTLTPRLLRAASDRTAIVGAAAVGDAVICSYGLLVSESELLSGKKWATVVFDESQALKNASTQRHKAAASIQAGMRLALTGTPIENHLGELFSQFSILNPGMLGTATGFRSRFQRPIESGDHTVRRHLKQLVSPYLLRRTKGQVLDELPGRTDINVPVELGVEEAALYEAQRLSALAEIEANKSENSPIAVLAQLTRLRLLACSPRLVIPEFTGVSAKLEAFAQIVQNLQAGGHRALVFSQFVKHLTLIREWLDANKITYQYLDGSTPARQRDLRVAAFQSGSDPLFLISTRAGGQGLNLTAADYVIHMDPWWNPAVEDQASDRAHRLGQRRPVTVYRLYAQG